MPVDPFTILSRILETSKKIREIEEQIKNAELKSLIADLQLHIADLKSELYDFKETNLELRQQISELERKMENVSAEGEFVKHGGVYWLRDSDGNYEPNPYCHRCKDVMTPFPPMGTAFEFVCGTCNASAPASKPPKQ